jgi:hypothetical protein
MSKKNNIMSLSLDPDTQEKLRLSAKQKTNGNVSKLIRELVDKYLVQDDTVIPVVIKVPIEYKGDEERLKNWLDIKVSGIVKALSN